jgi:hypothetical protein
MREDCHDPQPWEGMAAERIDAACRRGCLDPARVGGPGRGTGTAFFREVAGFLNEVDPVGLN